jgi:hypothetical protein
MSSNSKKPKILINPFTGEITPVVEMRPKNKLGVSIVCDPLNNSIEPLVDISGDEEQEEDV